MRGHDASVLVRWDGVVGKHLRLAWETVYALEIAATMLFPSKLVVLKPTISLFS